MTAYLISRPEQIGASALIVGAVIAWVALVVWEHR